MSIDYINNNKITKLIEEIYNNKILNNLIENNCIYLNETIKINNINELKNIFTKSIIIKCYINNIQFQKLKYNSIILYLYELIKDINKIKSESLLNISLEKKYTDGYTYYKNLDISVQGVNANKSIKEIYKQATSNNIKINITIRLENNNIINLEF